MEEQYF